MRAVLWRAVAPAAAALEHMNDAANDPAVVHPLNATYIRRQTGCDPLPLLIVQPKQVLAHDPDPPSKNESGSYCRAGKINEF